MKIEFVTATDEVVTAEAEPGDNLLRVAQAAGLPLEGTCEGQMACSTCHVVVDQTYFDKLDEPTEDEEDMLDLAFGLTHTSRLGCQIVMSEDLDGLKVTLPKATRNMMVDRKV